MFIKLFVLLVAISLLIQAGLHSRKKYQHHSRFYGDILPTGTSPEIHIQDVFEPTSFASTIILSTSLFCDPKKGITSPWLTRYYRPLLKQIEFFRGWSIVPQCVVYVNKDLSTALIEELVRRGAIVKRMSRNSYHLEGTMWRFMEFGIGTKPVIVFDADTPIKDWKLDYISKWLKDPTKQFLCVKCPFFFFNKSHIYASFLGIKPTKFIQQHVVGWIREYCIYSYGIDEAFIKHHLQPLMTKKNALYVHQRTHYGDTILPFAIFLGVVGWAVPACIAMAPVATHGMVLLTILVNHAYSPTNKVVTPYTFPPVENININK